VNPLGQSLRSAVGDKTAKPLAEGLGLETVGDLLRHYPARFPRGR
jgi:ATP-dependent DNA helicase RecG